MVSMALLEAQPTTASTSGSLLLDLAAVALGKTAGDDDLQLRVLLLVGAGLQNVLNGLGLGALDKAAGVDQNNIGFTQVGHRLVTGRKQDVHHHRPRST